MALHKRFTLPTAKGKLRSFEFIHNKGKVVSKFPPNSMQCNAMAERAVGKFRSVCQWPNQF